MPRLHRLLMRPSLSGGLVKGRLQEGSEVGPRCRRMIIEIDGLVVGNTIAPAFGDDRPARVRCICALGGSDVITP